MLIRQKSGNVRDRGRRTQDSREKKQQRAGDALRGKVS